MTISTLYHRRHRLLLGADSDISPSETGGGRMRPSFTKEANFDTNVVIILAALLCALICALVLNTIVRCALRCNRRFSLEAPAETAARDASTGLKKSAIRQIPVVAYGAAQVNIVATDCTICLAEFVGGEKVRVLPICNHGFHVNCIDTWLVSHSNCPTCRRSLLDQALTTSEEASTVGSHGDAPMTADVAG